MDMSDMHNQARFPVPALAIAAGVILAGCTGSGTSSAAHRTTPSSSRHTAAGAQPTGPLGSAASPLMLSCDQESFGQGVIVSPSPMPRQPQPGPGDLVIGPLLLGLGKDSA